MSYQPIWDGRSSYGGKRRRPVLAVLLILLGLAAILFGLLELYIARNSETRIAQGADAPQVMVVFGCQVKSWGPSVLLQDRLDTALDYLETHPDMTVVVTGGKGDDEHQSEAECMRDYLVSHGFEGTILMEDQSRNTWQNIQYTRALLQEEDVHSGKYLLVSSGFHLARIKLLWQRAWGGTSTLSTLAAPVSHKPSAVQMFFREPLALAKSFVLDH